MSLEAGFRLGTTCVRPLEGVVETPAGVRAASHKPMQLLLFLAARAGETVTKEVIFAEVWAGAAVGDDVLTVAVSTLRRALGDDARRPRFIQTVPRVGYRLVAPVRPLGSVPQRRLPRSLPWLLGAGLAAAIGLVAVGSRQPSPIASSTAAPSVDALAATQSERPAGQLAEDAYLQGRYLLSRGGRGDLAAAVERFTAALAAQPRFAPAMVARAEAEIALAREGLRPSAEAFEGALASLDTALAIDPRLARAHALRGSVLLFHRWSFSEAELAFETALELDADDPVILDAWARYLAIAGRLEAAVAVVERLRDIDPSAYSRPRLAALLNLAGRHQAALAELEAQVAVAPDVPRLHLELALTRLRLGQLAPAFAAYREHRQLLGAGNAELAQLADVFADAGAAGVYRLLLAAHESAAAAGAPVSHCERAQLAAGAGERARALDALEQAIEAREPAVLGVATDLAFAALHGDPRFESLVASLGLPRAR